VNDEEDSALYVSIHYLPICVVSCNWNWFRGLQVSIRY